MPYCNFYSDKETKRSLGRRSLNLENYFKSCNTKQQMQLTISKNYRLTETCGSCVSENSCNLFNS